MKLINFSRSGLFILSQGSFSVRGGGAWMEACAPLTPTQKRGKKILSRGGLNKKFNGHLLGGREGGVTCVHAHNFVTSLALKM